MSLKSWVIRKRKADGDNGGAEVSKANQGSKLSS